MDSVISVAVNHLTRVFLGMLRCSLIATSIFMVGCGPPAHQAIIGVWRSDTERTLESMREATDLPSGIRAQLENDFFGYLVVEYQEDTIRARFLNSSYDTGYQPYEVITVSEEKIVTREWNELLQQFEMSTTYLDGECIYGKNAQYTFREYFCPFEQRQGKHVFE